MKLSVVIVTWNSRNHIAPCLTSLMKQVDEPSMEIVVVDNGSQDGTKDLIRRQFSSVRLLTNERNEGFTRACNRGLAESQGQYVLLLNPDTVPLSGSLSRMIQYMEIHAEVGALGPQLLFPDGRVQPSCRQFPDYRLMLWEFTGLRLIFPGSRIFGAWRMSYFQHRQPRSVDQPMGACLLLRRSALEAIGTLDERFEMFFSDVDLCHRLKTAGWEIIFLPSAQVVHWLGSSVRQAQGRMLLASHRDCYRYFKKQRRKLRDYPASWILGLGLAVILPVRVLYGRIREVLFGTAL